MKVFNGLAKAIKAWFELDARLYTIESQLKDVRDELKEHERLIMNLYDRIDRLYEIILNKR